MGLCHRERGGDGLGAALRLPALLLPLPWLPGAPARALSARRRQSHTVYLNGQALTPIRGFTGSPVTELANAATFLKPGENCLQAQVTNTGGLVTGLWLSGTLTATAGACSGLP